MNCVKEGKHVGKLIEIYRAYGSCCGDWEEVVRWCPQCGSVVVDVDVDNRTKPGHFMKMRFPKNENSSIKFRLQSV